MSTGNDQTPTPKPSWIGDCPQCHHRWPAYLTCPGGPYACGGPGAGCPQCPAAPPVEPIPDPDNTGVGLGDTVAGRTFTNGPLPPPSCAPIGVPIVTTSDIIGDRITEVMTSGGQIERVQVGGWTITRHDDRVEIVHAELNGKQLVAALAAMIEMGS